MLGSEDQPKDVLEYLVIERHLVNPYGRWRLHGKIVPSWAPAKDPIIKVSVHSAPPDILYKSFSPREAKVRGTSSVKRKLRSLYKPVCPYFTLTTGSPCFRVSIFFRIIFSPSFSHPRCCSSRSFTTSFASSHKIQPVWFQSKCCSAATVWQESHTHSLV